MYEIKNKADHYVLLINGEEISDCDTYEEAKREGIELDEYWSKKFYEDYL